MVGHQLRCRLYDSAPLFRTPSVLVSRCAFVTLSTSYVSWGLKTGKLWLQGNIAAGKSTLLRILDSAEYEIVPEPITKWQQVNP